MEVTCAVSLGIVSLSAGDLGSATIRMQGSSCLSCMEDLINRVSQTAATDKLAGSLKSLPADYKLEVFEKEKCLEK